MAPRKKNPEKKEPDTRDAASHLRKSAEAELGRTKTVSSIPGSRAPEALIHELQVHQIELEMQTEELRRVHLELEESRDKYLDLYEFAPVGYLTLTDNGLISEVNLTGAAILGLERHSLTGTRFSRFVAEPMSSAWHQYFIALHGGKEKQICNLTLIRADGSLLPARLESLRIFRASDRAVTVRVAISDISDLRQVQVALRMANKKLNLLSGITRHDINNQLLALSGFLELLHRKVPDPALDAEFARLTELCERLSRIISFTKEYEQVGVNSPSWQDCRMLAAAAAGQVRLGNITVKNELPDGAEVFADPLIARVFYNITENAVRYGGKLTTIRFALQESGKNAIISCEDDGEGIALAEKERIFERGFGKNTGLGLWLSREILAITGITIREKGEQGRGARFEMIVPEGAWRMRHAGPGRTT